MTAVITLCSEARLDHVRRQQAFLQSVPVRRVVVWLDAEPPPPFSGAVVRHVPPGPHGMRLAAGRNEGARAAGAADLLVFLDADCLPGPELLARYRSAAGAHPDALLCGPVTYLRSGVTPSRVDALPALTAPHPARPAPPPGETVVAGPDDYRLFWSLSFAVTAPTWEALGGFDEAYEGYGGEDTDLAWTARKAAVPLVWVGGAHAYHQYHPTSSPPWQHLDDILRNGRLFAARWGFWPMQGWLDAFAEAGAIEHTPTGWQRVRNSGSMFG
ncbi:glycosyltransferase family 2 protein [Actinoplanes sp. TRM 88003]|uniref:Glycosyltransferase family 2 protein n=1 Tax=Paractinoplanes aksuensis TaxID=2939490 RepID=A0ABT1DLB1_9ACTN|nr:galactosyltransferase-related protein [Actinoplanes aksuensis]MCO8271623.1 glycosyltransferase family 2 protein [Actinoplanes aksuensis]